LKVYAEHNYGGWVEVLKTAPLRASGGIMGGTESIVTEDKAVDAKNFVEGSVNGSITSSAAHKTESNNVVRQQYAVRRLTPLECERLQGLPDNYTYLPGVKCCSDSARYKALGNGMAQPCCDFVLRRIVEAVEGVDYEQQEDDS